MTEPLLELRALCVKKSARDICADIESTHMKGVGYFIVNIFPSVIPSLYLLTGLSLPVIYRWSPVYLLASKIVASRRLSDDR